MAEGAEELSACRRSLIATVWGASLGVGVTLLSLSLSEVPWGQPATSESHIYSFFLSLSLSHTLEVFHQRPDRQKAKQERPQEDGLCYTGRFENRIQAGVWTLRIRQSPLRTAVLQKTFSWWPGESRSRGLMVYSTPGTRKVLES